MTTNRSELVGYVRKSNAGNALKLNILKSALEDAQTVEGKDGTEYVSLIMNLSKVKMIIGDEREVTSVCQLTEVEPVEPTPEPLTKEEHTDLERKLDEVQKFLEDHVTEAQDRKIAKALDEIYNMTKPE